ncbi:polysaccharide deacetylase family protein [Nocardioides panacis]|uniref:Polysaccharide deacetylase family protein n=1 Tax=Nocardioides panacis TaxID=2849501 RepID=A0A975T0V1_9ACTN|nr:polysaccharide deacetylase family protein [Nocardioides panacis]QWZ09550.1 polysaccharide deacetylase family protein [Nocardioides panacis]
MTRRVRCARFYQLAGLAMALVLAVPALGSAATAGTASGSTGPTTPAKTVVSITFDDGQATQYSTLPVLRSHAMAGTFYVNSGMVGSSSFYMGWQQLYQLANAGNEIGGHTSHHAVLDQVSEQTAVKEVCDDRAHLIREGFAPVTSFAYPTAAVPRSTSMVRSCGYSSARGVGQAAGQYWENMPPVDAYKLRTPQEARIDTNVQDLERVVTNAEQQNGTRWVILVFHGICDSSCTSQESTTSSRFEQLVAWLDAQRSAGKLEVRTVGDVIANGSQASSAPPHTKVACTPSPCSDPRSGPSGVRISMHVTGGAGPAATYYTTDGTDPKTSASWQRYVHPFVVSGSTTLRFYSRDAASHSETARTQRIHAVLTDVAGGEGPGQTLGVTPRSTHRRRHLFRVARGDRPRRHGSAVEKRCSRSPAAETMRRRAMRVVGAARSQCAHWSLDRRVAYGGLSAVAVMALALLVTATLAYIRLPPPSGQGAESEHPSGFPPPPPSGYFSTLPPGSWSQLPRDARCAQRVHASTWEPRPDNYGPNHTMPPRHVIHTSLVTLPRDRSYAAKWYSWLLPRVTGAHRGTTDQNIQWAACKWGVSDNLLRAIAVHESTWTQYDTYRSGRCVLKMGCGDLITQPTAASRRYCAFISRAGHDYERDYGRGRCPATFSIVGVKSWQDPTWGAMPHNQNGTFPFNRDSTAFALDYLGSFLRGCYEGWVPWLANTGDHSYAAGDIWGCVGAWYAGAWRSAQAATYIGLVRGDLHRRSWLEPTFARQAPPCSAAFGCPLSRVVRGRSD